MIVHIISQSYQPDNTFLYFMLPIALSSPSVSHSPLVLSFHVLWAATRDRTLTGQEFFT